MAKIPQKTAVNVILAQTTAELIDAFVMPMADSYFPAGVVGQKTSTVAKAAIGGGALVGAVISDAIPSDLMDYAVVGGSNLLLKAAREITGIGETSTRTIAPVPTKSGLDTPIVVTERVKRTRIAREV